MTDKEKRKLRKKKMRSLIKTNISNKEVKCDLHYLRT